MFLVELSHNTINEEIDDLVKKASRREVAIKESNKQLENDHLKLMRFIEEDNKTTNEKEKQ